LKSGPLAAPNVREMLKRRAHKAGIDKRVHPHGLRHTHAMELIADERIPHQKTRSGARTHPCPAKAIGPFESGDHFALCESSGRGRRHCNWTGACGMVSFSAEGTLGYAVSLAAGLAFKACGGNVVSLVESGWKNRRMRI